MSRSDRVIGSLLCGLMGAFAVGAIPWMADAGARWIVASCLIGFSIVTWLSLHVGIEASEKLSELSDKSTTARILFDPVLGIVPIVSAFAVGGVVVGVLLMTTLPLALSVTLGLITSALAGAMGIVLHFLSRRASQHAPDEQRYDADE